VSVTIRRLNESDAALGARIAFVFAGNAVSEEHVARFLSNPGNYLIAALADGEPAGFLSAHALARFKDYRTKLFIYEVDVLPAFQQQGIGKGLVNAILDIGRTEGVDTAFVLTSRSNDAANALYSATGGVYENGDDMMFVYHL
jgi:aminoglycoside 6'-N-acetyltransferase I